MAHIINLVKNFNEYVMSDYFYFYANIPETGEFNSELLKGSLSKEDFLNLINKQHEPIDLIYDDLGFTMLIKLTLNNKPIGFLSIYFSNHLEAYVKINYSYFKSFSRLLIHSIQLVTHYDSIHRKIKHLTDANEFIGRLSINSFDALSVSIFNQLKTMFRFDHIIMPNIMDNVINWQSSTTYVPKHIRDIIENLDVISNFKFPYQPVLYERNTDSSESIQIICDYYGCHQLYVLPIVEDDLMVGFLYCFK